MQLVLSCFPKQGANLRPWQWKSWVLTTEPPGNHHNLSWARKRAVVTSQSTSLKPKEWQKRDMSQKQIHLWKSTRQKWPPYKRVRWNHIHFNKFLKADCGLACQFIEGVAEGNTESYIRTAKTNRLGWLIGNLKPQHTLSKTRWPPYYRNVYECSKR